MTQKEKTLTVAKSTIFFKTTDEWFKTLVSGVVETFFPDKELTFSIELKKRKGLAYGICCWGNPRHIEINSRYIGKGGSFDNGTELAGTIAHEIIHVFAKGYHGADFQKEAANIGLYWYENDTAGHTEPSREFAERIAPVLKQLEKTGLKVFPLKHSPKEYPDVFLLVKNGVNKWMTYYDCCAGDLKRAQIRQKAVRLAAALGVSEINDGKKFLIKYNNWEASVFEKLRYINIKNLSKNTFFLVKNAEGNWISLPKTNDAEKAAARQKVVRSIAALETAFPSKMRKKHPFFTVPALCSNEELFGNLLSVYYPHVSYFYSTSAGKEQPALPPEKVVTLRETLNASFQAAAASDLGTLKKLIGRIDRETKTSKEPVGQAELELKRNERRKERSEKFFIRRDDERYADVKSDWRWKSFPEKLRVIRKYFPDWC